MSKKWSEPKGKKTIKPKPIEYFLGKKNIPKKYFNIKKYVILKSPTPTTTGMFIYGIYEKPKYVIHPKKVIRLV